MVTWGSPVLTPSHIIPSPEARGPPIRYIRLHCPRRRHRRCLHSLSGRDQRRRTWKAHRRWEPGLGKTRKTWIVLAISEFSMAINGESSIFMGKNMAIPWFSTSFDDLNGSANPLPLPYRANAPLITLIVLFARWGWYDSRSQVELWFGDQWSKWKDQGTIRREMAGKADSIRFPWKFLELTGDWNLGRSSFWMKSSKQIGNFPVRICCLEIHSLVTMVVHAILPSG